MGLSRRSYLATMGIAGMSGVAIGSRSSSQSSSPSKHLSLIDYSTKNETGLPVHVELTPVNRTQTEEKPISINISFRWEGDQSAEIVFDSTPPLSLPTYSTDETPGSVLLPTHYRDEKADNNCWTPPLGDDASIAWRIDPSIVEFSPKQTVDIQADLWADQRFVDCLEPQEYSFVGIFGTRSVAQSDYSPPEGEFNRYSWEFSMELSY